MHTTDSGLTPAIPDYAVPASGTRADPACAGEGGGSPAGTLRLDVDRSYSGYLEAYGLVGISHDTSSSVIGEHRAAGITLGRYMDASSGDTFPYPRGNYTKGQIGGWTAYSASISWEGEGSCTLGLQRGS